MEVKIGIGCPRCGEMMSESVLILTDDQVVDLSLFTCTTFECEACGAFAYTGDLDSMMEYDEDEWPDEPEWDEDEED